MPAVGRNNPTAMDSVVVLPAPLGPSSPKNDPVGTSRFTPATATLLSNRFTSPRSANAGATAARATSS